MQTNPQASRPLFFLGGYLVITQVMSGFTNAHAPLSNNLNNLGLIVFYWALGWWFINDSRKYDIRWIDQYLDMGMFLYIGWIFLVPIYFFKTRGWKALFTIGALVSMAVVAYIGGVVFYTIINMF